MGLDFGDKTVGVAVTDALGITAQGVETIRRERPTKYRQTLARIKTLIDEYGVSKVVIGLPLGLKGAEGDRCEHTREFGEALSKRIDIPIDYFDERLTTVQAHRAMDDMGISAANHKEYVDEIAAVLILQGYLDGKD